MIEHENSDPAASESAVNNNLEAQLESLPAEYPPIPDGVVAEIVDRDGHPLRRGDVERLQRNWMIEQRLAAINNARETGSITPEVANTLELDALRKMRDNIHFYGEAVGMNTVHKKMESHGAQPLNVSRPGRPPKSPDNIVRLEF